VAGGLGCAACDYAPRLLHFRCCAVLVASRLSRRALVAVPAAEPASSSNSWSGATSGPAAGDTEPPRGKRAAARLPRLLTLLATGTIAHTLVTSVRRRRRELAILESARFVPRQVRAAAWLGSFLPIRLPSSRCRSSPRSSRRAHPACRHAKSRVIAPFRTTGVWTFTYGRARPAPAGPQ
jgi:hypothetical protein